MPYKDSNENQDTLKLKVPSQADRTRIYKTADTEEARTRAARSEANRKAVQQSSQTSSSQSPSPNTHKKRRVPASGNQTVRKTPVQNTSQPKQPAPQHRTAPAVQQQTTVPRNPAPQNSAGSAEYSNVGHAKRRKKSGQFTFGKFLRIVAATAVVLFLIYSSAALFYIGKINNLETTGEYVNDPETMLYSSDIKNILIIGEDTRDTAARGLSDSMILLSVNKKKHRLQMTSFMRDIYTEIDGYDPEKLNAAYAYGGAELLKDTIEDNFKIRIDGCVTVNFIAVAYLVDAVGGVQVTVSAEEANAVNDILYSEVNELMGCDDPYDGFLPVSDGTFLLSGKQALSYSRIRYVGDADFERTQRQRTVITQMMQRAKKIKLSDFNSNMIKALQYTGTDMSVTDMYLLSLRLPFILGSYEPEQLRVPADGTWYFDETWDGMSIITVDFYANTEYLKNSIYIAGSENDDTEE